MRYIIMCGGRYLWRKHFEKIKGEILVERTIRLLRENGVEDIAISSNDDAFAQFGVPLLKRENKFAYKSADKSEQYWIDGFYLTDDPVCYIFGDVVFSPEAIKTIVKTETDDVEFFASAPPFDERYIKPWAEPFAFKVTDTQHFKTSIAVVKRWQDAGLFKRIPIAWELWQVIKDTPINEINYGNYTVINDYTCDIDYRDEPEQIEQFV